MTLIPPEPAPPVAVTSSALESAPSAVSVPVVMVTLRALMSSVFALVAEPPLTSVDPVPV